MKSFILLALLLAPPVQPGELPLSIISRVELLCPVCTRTFQAAAIGQSNTRAGVDRDLFARALGPQPEFYRIATCAHCGYSGYFSDFDPDLKIPDAVRDKILKAPKLKLPNDFGPDSDPRELDASDRYALAVQCYTWRGKSHEALAWLHLRASWVARDKGSILPPDPRLKRVMEFSEQWRPMMRPGENQVDVELRMVPRMAEALMGGRFNRYQRPYVELAMALILRRHGENRQALPLLRRLAERAEFEPPLQRGIRNMLASIEAEQAQQRKALEHFRSALEADEVQPPNRGAACYLLAELHRRLGHDDAARPWYGRAEKEPDLPPYLLEWTRQQAEWTATATQPK